MASICRSRMDRLCNMSLENTTSEVRGPNLTPAIEVIVWLSMILDAS